MGIYGRLTSVAHPSAQGSWTAGTFKRLPISTVSGPLFYIPFARLKELEGFIQNHASWAVYPGNRKMEHCGSPCGMRWCNYVRWEKGYCIIAVALIWPKRLPSVACRSSQGIGCTKRRPVESKIDGDYRCIARWKEEIEKAPRPDLLKRS